MKNSIKLFIVFCLILGIKNMNAQCTASIIDSLMPNGVVNFTGMATPSSTNTNYYWYLPGSNNPSGINTSTASVTYSANGTYTVMLSIWSSGPPSCSTSVMGVVTITNVAVSSTCNLNVNTTPASSSVTCDGSATVVPSSLMCSPISYTWYPMGVNGSACFNMCPGTTYTVVASSAGGVNCCSLAVGFGSVGVTNTPTCNLNANFSWTQTANGGVTFNNYSTGTNGSTTYSWNFGDGATSTAASPAHTYSANGMYTVTLVATDSSNPSCTNTQTWTVYVNSYCNISANFTYSVLSNGMVSFTNLTTGATAPTGYNWNFGDGGTSWSTNPTHQYINGVYMVTLTATNYSTSVPCNSTYTAQIVITTNTCNLNASFTTSNTGSGTVLFNSTSTGVNSNCTYSWYFGDGNYVPNGSSSISHTYAGGGLYTAYLVVMDTTSNFSCVDSVSTTFSVTGLPCVANSNFSLTPSGTPQYWFATPDYPWNVTGALWSWGDGSYSNTLYTSHNYSVAGTYTICLTVTVSCGATASTCTSYAIYRTSSPTQDMSMISVNVVAPGTVTGLLAASREELNYSIYPNPTNGNFSLNMDGLKSADAKIAVYNLVGELVYSAQAGTDNGSLAKDIQLNDVSNGVYFIKVSAGNKVFTKKVIVNKQ